MSPATGRDLLGVLSVRFQMFRDQTCSYPELFSLPQVLLWVDLAKPLSTAFWDLRTMIAI